MVDFVAQTNVSATPRHVNVSRISITWDTSVHIKHHTAASAINL